MARPMWRGAIQFGLVTIPVRLYLATESGGIGFNMLHARCLNRIQMKTYCPVDDEVISRADTVRGYEWAKGQYVVVTDEDLESLPLKTIRTIEIELFFEQQRDTQGVQFVKQAYYLEPEPIGRKAFYLLKSVLADTGKTALAKIVLKDREQLAALNPYGSTLLVTTLHWPDEIRSVEELELPEAEHTFKPAERRMAEQLVESMTGEFRAEEYRDEYRGALMNVIEAKIQGQAPARPERVTGTKLADLMEALEASVAAAREARREGAEPAAVAAGAAGGDGRKAAAEPRRRVAARKTA